jgi:hypothetical protein
VRSRRYITSSVVFLLRPFAVAVEWAVVVWVVEVCFDVAVVALYRFVSQTTVVVLRVAAVTVWASCCVRHED